MILHYLIQLFRLLMLRCLCWFSLLVSISAIMSLALINITWFTTYSTGNNVWKQATQLAKRVAVEATARDPANCFFNEGADEVLCLPDSASLLQATHLNPRDDSPVLLTSFALASVLQDLLSGFLVQVGTQVTAGKGSIYHTYIGHWNEMILSIPQ